MIPFALANAMTHVGANPLCFCCCDVSGGGQNTAPEANSDSRVSPHAIAQNPFLQFRPLDVATVPDGSDAPADVSLSEQVGLTSHLGRRQTIAHRLQTPGELAEHDYLDLIGLIALAEADEDDRQMIYLTLTGFDV